MDELAKIAKALVAPGKGILAADESSGTIKKRFDKYGLPDNIENHRVYRQLLFSTPGVEEFISGVILYDETIRQTADDGMSLAQLLSKEGIIPGIKVDSGTVAFEGGKPGELVTEGLDGLADRLKEYKQLGAKFTKWRAVITIDEDIPTDACIEENARRLAEFARLSQEAGLVPIVEPEVLMEGAHTIERCDEVTRKTLKVVFDELKDKGINWQGMLLKPNMVLPGKDSGQKVSAEQIADLTIDALSSAVPSAVPGIVFLSGGQSDEEAVLNLATMNKMNNEDTDPFKPQLSFSYGRGLQTSAYEALDGDLTNPSNRQAAQKAFFTIASRCSAARYGRY